jgi:hypothetical protein
MKINSENKNIYTTSNLARWGSNPRSSFLEDDAMTTAQQRNFFRAHLVIFLGGGREVGHLAAAGLAWSSSKEQRSHTF